jgi:hypothetical protein
MTTENFTISNVSINDAIWVDENHVCFDIKTQKGNRVRVLEWLNDDVVERVDSHLKTNEYIDQLFNDYVPYNEIFDAVDAELEKLESENV